MNNVQCGQIVAGAIAGSDRQGAPLRAPQLGGHTPIGAAEPGVHASAFHGQLTAAQGKAATSMPTGPMPSQATHNG